MEPTKNQKIKYFGASDPEKKKNRSIEEQVNEFLVQDSINVIGIAMSEYGVVVLYEDKI